MADRLLRWADFAWPLFPPLGIVLDFCAFVADVLTLTAAVPDTLKR